MQHLQRLQQEEVWSGRRAQRFFGEYGDLVRARVLVEAPSEVGMVVFLDVEGRRLVNLNPYKNVSIDRFVNLLYLRMAARHFGWRLLKEPFAGERKRASTLERLAVLDMGGKSARVMAKCTAGGFDRRAVTQTHRFLYSTLLARDESLVVVMPSLQRTGRMEGRGGTLQLVAFEVQPGPG